MENDKNEQSKNKNTTMNLNGGLIRKRSQIQFQGKFMEKT